MKQHISYTILCIILGVTSLDYCTMRKEAKKGKSLSQAEDFGDPKPAMKDLKRVLCGLEYLHTLAQAQPSPCLPHTT